MGSKSVVTQDNEVVEIDPDLIPPSVMTFMRFGEMANRIRAGAGIVGFLVAGFTSHSQGAGLVTAAGRALLGALICYMVAWLLWLLIARSMRKDAVEDLTRLRDEGLAVDQPGNGSNPLL